MKRSLVLGSTLLALAPGSARADSPRSGVRTDVLQPASIESPFQRAEGPFAAAAEEVRFAAGFSVEYAKSPLRLLGVDASGAATELARLVDHAVVARVSLAIAPTRWLRIDGTLPVALFQEGSPGEGRSVSWGGLSVPGAAAFGLGDPRLGLFFRAFESKPFSFGLGAHVWAPVGSRDAYLSDGRIRGELDFHFFGDAAGFLWGASLSGSPGLFAERDGDRASLSLALHRQIVPVFSLGLEPAMVLALDRVGPDASAETKPRWMIEPMLSARLRPGPVQITLAGGPGFGDLPGTADARFALTIAYIGRVSTRAPVVPGDGDGDGLLDKEDACPEAAGPRSDDPKRTGCPNDDGDGDGVPNDEDRCPGTFGVRSGPAEGRGCPDTDNDTFADPVDECPLQPSFRADGKGCPARTRLGKKGFTVTPPASFKAGEVKISADVQAVLGEVAATLLVAKQISQLNVSLGSKGVPASIADQRAAALVKFFQAAGVAPQRIQVEYDEQGAAGSLAFTLP